MHKTHEFIIILKKEGVSRTLMLFINSLINRSPIGCYTYIRGASRYYMFNKFLNFLQGSVKLKTQPVSVWSSVSEYYLCFQCMHAKSLQSCPTLWLHRWQPTMLPSPLDSPGKNTGVGCHFFLQCMKVKSESEVTQSCPTLSDPMNCSLPGSSIYGIFQARVQKCGAIAFSLGCMTHSKAAGKLEKTWDPGTLVFRPGDF